MEGLTIGQLVYLDPNQVKFLTDILSEWNEITDKSFQFRGLQRFLNLSQRLLGFGDFERVPCMEFMQVKELAAQVEKRIRSGERYPAAFTPGQEILNMPNGAESLMFLDFQETLGIYYVVWHLEISFDSLIRKGVVPAGTINYFQEFRLGTKPYVTVGTRSFGNLSEEPTE